MKRLLLLLVLLMAACSPTTTNNTSSTAPTSTIDSEPIPTQEGGDATIVGDPGSSSGLGNPLRLAGEGFVAAANGGDVALSFNGTGYYACENGNTYALRPASGGLPQLTIILPMDITPGTYTIGDRNITVSVVTADNQVYAGVLNGILVLEEVATAANQRVKGSLDVDLSNGTNSINAQALFDFTTTSTTVFCS
jgi:hypothetical protein